MAAAATPHDGATITRLEFLMRYLAWRIDETVERTVAVLDGDLGYTIPLGIPDPEGRAWQDPREPDLRLVIHTAPGNTPRTSGFTLAGRGRLAGLVVQSCGLARHGGVCWTTVLDLPADGLGAATARVLDALWSLPAWRARQSFDFDWLEPAALPHRA